MAGGRSMGRLAILTTHPIQYHVPVWRRLAQDQDLEIRVYFGSELGVREHLDKEFGVRFKWDVPLTEGYPCIFLSTNPAICDSSRLDLNIPEFVRQMKIFQPNYALITGYHPFAFYLKAFLVLQCLGIPVFLRGEATDEALARGPLKTLVRHWFLKILYSRITGFMVIGENARRHYLARGVSPKRLFWSPYSTDTDFFEQQVQYWAPLRSKVRRELGFSEEQIVFLFCGKLIQKKNPLIIPAALKHISKTVEHRIGLLFVGDGSLRSTLESEMAATSVKVSFVGFRNQSEISRFYSAADCLILPSSWGETWGIVVNEALQFGIPAVVSDKVGCRHDLIVEGTTGYVFRSGDAFDLAQRLEEVVDLLHHRRIEVRKACRLKVEDYSVEKAVRGIREACVAHHDSV